MIETLTITVAAGIVAGTVVAYLLGRLRRYLEGKGYGR